MACTKKERDLDPERCYFQQIFGEDPEERAETGQPQPLGVVDDREPSGTRPRRPRPLGVVDDREPSGALDDVDDVLTLDERAKAFMIQAGHTAYEKGFDAAQEEMDTTLPGWVIDTELSTGEGLVLSNGVEVRIAYRGTDWGNMGDVITDAATFVGLEDIAPQMKDSDAQLRATLEKYGNVSELIGYSKGGAHALHMGDKYNIPTTSFNPFIGRTQINSVSVVPHIIIRTVDDPVSVGVVSSKDNYKVKNIHPHIDSSLLKSHELKQFTVGGEREENQKSNVDVKAAVRAHDLRQFTGTGARQSVIHTDLMGHVQQGQELAHFETMDAMKSGIESGKTFTAALDDFNSSHETRQRVDVLPDGALGPRIHSESDTVKYWAEAGGKFEPHEEVHFRSNVPPARTPLSVEAREMGVIEGLSDAQRAHFNQLSAEQRGQFMTQKRAHMAEQIQAVDRSLEPHRAVLKNLAKNVGHGAASAASGWMSHALWNIIDPDGELDNVVREAGEGATSGLTYASGMSIAGAVFGGVAGVAALPEVVAGAVSYVAGNESGKAITEVVYPHDPNNPDEVRSGVKQEVADAVGSIAGGAIGGASGVVALELTGIATMAASAAVFGTEMGAIGGPVGMAMGAAAGATIGAVIGGLGYIFGHHGN